MRLATCSTALLLSGCGALTGGRPVIEQRFASYTYADDTNHSVGIRVSSSEVEKPASGISLAALGDHAQAAMVEQFKGKPPVLIKGPKDPAPIVTARDTISRHLVVAVQPTTFLAPGDRVDAVQISLKVTPDEPRRWWITSWTRATNGKSLIDLGKLTDTTSSKIGFETGLKVAGFLPDAKLTAENGQATAREVQMRDATEFDAAVDGGGRAWLTETAGWRESSAHNFAVDVVLTTEARNLFPSPTVSFGDLESEVGGRMVPAEAKMVLLRPGVVYAPIEFQRDPVCGVAEITYRIRHVVSGYSTFSEADDVVEFSTGTDHSTFLISPAPIARYYVLNTVDGRSMSYQMKGAASPSLMMFETLEEATTFRNWLRMRAPSTGELANAAVGFSRSGTLHPAAPQQYATLTPAAQSEEQIRPTASTCVS